MKIGERYALGSWSIVLLTMISCTSPPKPNSGYLLSALSSPQLFVGDSVTAYRDPAVIFHADTFFLFFTLVEISDNDSIFSFTVQTQSHDLLHWAPLQKITPRHQSLNYCSPGNVIFYRGEWLLCLQTYPRPDYTSEQMPRYGDKTARIFLMRSTDLKHWSAPEMMRVKGPEVPIEDMGRMIDPYLVEDRAAPGKWWCLYKQNGVSMSFTHDFQTWEYAGRAESGENVCVLAEEEGYVLFHSPKNGIGKKRSPNLLDWRDVGGLITLGQAEWEWAMGRITAGAVMDLRHVEDIGKYVMFFHGSGPLSETEGDFDKNASIGIAWSQDLEHWEWPGSSLSGEVD